MTKRTNRLSWALLALSVIFGLSAAQEEGSVKRYFELGQLGDVPGDIQVSTDYLTVVEFEGHDVEEARSARPDLFTIQSSENVITIRANEAVIGTDLYARVAGQTVLFRLVSNEQATGPRRYVVRDTPQAPRDLRNFSGSAGSPRPPAAEEPPLFPQGLLFEADFFRPRQTEIVIQYRLMNESKTPIINDPYRLRIYYGDTSIEYDRESSPAPGRPNFLAPGESEFGQIVIPKAPNDLDELELEWVLTEVGPGTQHKLIRNLAELAEISPGTRLESVATPPETVDDDILAETPPETAPETSADTLPAANDDSQNSQADALPKTDERAELASQAFVNSSFDTDVEDWYVWAEPDTGAEATGSVSNAENCAYVSANGAEAWHVRFALGDLALPSQDYLLRYDAYVDGASELALSAGIILDEPPYTSYVWNGATLSSEKKTFEHRFTLEKEDDDNAMLSFLLGKEEQNEAPYKVCFDNIQLSASADNLTNTQTDSSVAESPDTDKASGAEQDAPQTEAGQASALVNSDFEAGIEDDWVFYTQEAGEATVEPSNGEACFAVTQAGAERYHIGFLQLGQSLKAGQDYTFSFDAHSEQSVEIQAIVSMQEDPWTDYQKQLERLEPEKRSYSYDFTMPEDQSQARVIFELGGAANAGLGAYEFCLDNIYLGEAAGQAATNE